MGRGNDRLDRQSKRALEEIEKGVTRGDVERTLEGLRALDAEASAAWVPRAAPVVQSAIVAAQRSAQWGRLASIAQRVLELPGLLAPPSPAEPAPVTLWWALCWGCAHVKDWARAMDAWGRIEDSTERESPELAAAMRSFLESRGETSEAALQALRWPVPEAPDPRLGYDAPTRRVAVSAPQEESAVPGALAALAEAGPFASFGAEVQRWARAQPALAAALHLQGTRVAVRELLRRAAHRPPQPIGDLVGFLAQSVQQDAQGALEAEVVRLFRAASWWLSHRHPHADGARSVWRLAAEYLVRRDAWRVWVRDTFLSLNEDAFSSEQWVSYAQALFEAAPHGPLWTRAARAFLARRQHAKEHEQAAFARPARGLLELFERALARDPDGLRGSIVRAEEPLPTMIAEFVCFQASAEPFARLVDLVWDSADATLRTTIARLFYEQLEESAELDIDGIAGLFPSFLGRNTVDSVVEMALQEPSTKRLWERIGTRVAPYQPELLRVALRRAGPPGSAAFEALVRASLGDGSRFDWYLRTVRVLHSFSSVPKATLGSLLQEGIDRFAGDVEVLARGVMNFEQEQIAWPLRAQLCGALLAARDQSPSTQRSEIANAAIKRASLYLNAAVFGGKAKKKPAAKKKTPAAKKKKTPAVKETRAKKGAAKEQASAPAASGSAERGAAAPAKPRRKSAAAVPPAPPGKTATGQPAAPPAKRPRAKKKAAEEPGSGGNAS